MSKHKYCIDDAKRKQAQEMKYFIYCRKSSEQEDRQILSLPAQIKELTDYAKKENLQIVDTYQESRTAHKIGRPFFNEMITRIERGEANGIVVWDESRIARNSLDGGKIIYMLDEDVIKEIHKPGKVYRNTPDDKSWLGMIFTMTKKDSDDKSVNVKRGLREKAEQGWRPYSWSPAGYIWDKFAERGNKTLLKDPIRFPLIKKAWELMLTGSYTVPKILDILNNEWGYKTLIRKTIGGNPMARSTLYEIFTSPFYYGEYQYPDHEGTIITHIGRHNQMVSPEEYERVQVLLGRTGRPRPKTHSFAYTGLMTCGECGAMVTAEEKWQIICPSCRHKFSSNSKDACPKCHILIEEMKNPTLLYYYYYHCTKRKNPNCTQKSITAVELEKQIQAILEKIQISEKFKGWAIKYLNELNDQEVDHRNTVLESLQEAYKDCIKRIDNLVKLKISPQNSDGSLFSDEEFKNQKTSLMKEKVEYEQKLGATASRVDEWLELSERTFNFACYAQYWFENGTLQQKKEIFQSLGSNLSLINGIVRVELEKPFEFFEEAKKETPEISPMFEPKEKTDTEAQTTPYFAENPALLPL